MTRISIVDDDATIREGLEIVLAGRDRSIATYPSGEAFLEALAQGATLPDIAFIDLKMTGITGIEVLEAVHEKPFVKVMITGHGDVANAVRAIKLGAFDFIEKPFQIEALEALISAIEGKDGDLDGLARTDIAPTSVLTPREAEVALALNRGLTNKEVARELDLSPRTVEIHRARIFEKLEVRNLAGLVKLLTRAGY